MKVVIYVRPDCHLCAEAVAAARSLTDRFDLEIETVDIERDDDLHRRYLEAIPVVEIEGVECLRIDGHRYGGLEAAIAAAAADE